MMKFSEEGQQQQQLKPASISTTVGRH